MMDYKVSYNESSGPRIMICIGCILMQLVACGLIVNAFSVSQPYILRSGNFTNAQTSVIITIRGITYLAALILTGVFYRKLDYRLGMAVSTLIGAIAFFVFAFSRSLLSYYIAGAVAGLSYGFGSMVPATVLITRWFRKKQGLAIGIAAASTGFGSLAFSPLVRWFIETFSLKSAFIMQGILSFILAVLVWFLIRNDCPVYSDMDEENASEKTSYVEKKELSRKGMGGMLRTLVFLALIFVGGVSSPGYSHLMILYTTAGFDTAQISFGLSLLGLFLILGKLFFGSLYDRIGAFRSDFVFFSLLTASLFCCSLADLGSYPLMFASFILFGLGIPVSTVGFSIWAKDFSTPETLADEVKNYQIAFGIGNLIFSVMPGTVADIAGSYAPAYLIFMGMAVFSFITIQSAYIIRSKRRAEDGCQ